MDVNDEDQAAIDVLDAAAAGVEIPIEADDIDEDQDVGEDQEEETQEPTEIEALAMDMGWAPAEKWRGDPDKHVDAKTFIRTGPEILKTTLRKQDEKLDEVAGTIRGMANAAKGASERAYQRAVADLMSQRDEAVADGDVDEFKRIDNEIGTLELPVDPVARQPENEPGRIDPEFGLFISKNSWYDESSDNFDYEAAAHADEIAAQVGRKYQGADFYQELSKVVQEKFPDKFRNTKRDRPSAVQGAGGPSGGRSKAKGYADLPAEAKAACDDYVADGFEAKDYVKDYFGEE